MVVVAAVGVVAVDAVTAVVVGADMEHQYLPLLPQSGAHHPAAHHPAVHIHDASLVVDYLVLALHTPLHK
jgi:hypothetical protein